MPLAADTPRGSPPFFARPGESSAPADDARLRETLKRCPASTYEAARLFRQTGNLEHLPALVRGMIARFVEPDLRAKLQDPADALRLREDLGLDSLTLMEFVMFAEDVLQISIDNDELCHVRTLGNVRHLIACAVRGLPSNESTQLPAEHRGRRPPPRFPAPRVPARPPADYQLLAGMPLRPKRLAAEGRERSG